MYIYRIEHSISRDGPYNTDLLYDVAWQTPMQALRTKLHAINNQHDRPSMWSDCNRSTSHNYHEYFCGFKSIDDLHAWFGLCYQELQDAGYIVAIFHIDDSYVNHGKKQSIFVRNCAVLCDEMSIQDIMSLF